MLTLIRGSLVSKPTTKLKPPDGQRLEAECGTGLVIRDITRWTRSNTALVLSYSEEIFHFTEL